MTLSLKRRDFLLGAAASGLALTQGAGRLRAAEAPLKVGFAYVGPVGDYGWTHGHDVARKAVEAHFGDKVQTTYVENVSEGPDAERVIRQLATRNDLVFTTTFGFMNPTARVAKLFPKVKFEHATGYMTLPNMSAYNARFYEGRAVVGTLAGHMSKTGKIGYVGSFPIPEVVMGINATALAARRIRPDAEVRVVWVNEWYDPGKEAEAAKALIDQGVDFMTQHTDSPAPLQTAENRGIWGIGQASDMRAYAPKAQLTAIVDHWAPYYISRVQAVMDGTWQSQSVWYGMKEGMVQMAPFSDAVPVEALEAAKAVEAGIIDGSYRPFAGPIKDQTGALRVPEGSALSDAELLKMDWYVEGVQA